MLVKARNFYQFSALHSLLIGILPFFIPVLLWDKGASLSQISLFIAVTGLGFILSLWLWDRFRFQQRWKMIVALSFLVELLLVGALYSNLASEINVGWLMLLALVNGAYNCFYWSTQRAFFSHITTDKNTGKTFGNFQIVVVIMLKLGILTGGYLLQAHGMLSLLILSALITSFALWCLLRQQIVTTQEDSTEPPLSASQVVTFADQKQSKLIFLLDGPFLFLESYFWVLSLYFLAGESFFQLSIIVVALTILLSAIFYILKNKIDKVNQQRLFAIAIVFYALSWLLRAQLSSDTIDLILYPSIIVIGFLTTFFRLSFNKRFFDIAKKSTTYQYLVNKSYYSQLGIALIFSALALGLSHYSNAEQMLAFTYWLACPLALIYGLYAKSAFEFNIKQKLITSRNEL